MELSGGWSWWIASLFFLCFFLFLFSQIYIFIDGLKSLIHLRVVAVIVLLVGDESEQLEGLKGLYDTAWTDIFSCVEKIIFGIDIKVEIQYIELISLLL